MTGVPRAPHPAYSVVVVDNLGDGNGPRAQEASGDAGPVAAFLRRYADQIDPPKPVKPVTRTPVAPRSPLPDITGGSAAPRRDAVGRWTPGGDT